MDSLEIAQKTVLLPIKKIDGYHFDVDNKYLRSLMKEFDRLIQLDIRNFKKCKSL